MTHAGDTPERTLENCLSALKQEIRSNNQQVCVCVCFRRACGAHAHTHPASLRPCCVARKVLCLSPLCVLMPLPAAAAPQLHEVMLEAVVSCSHKTMHYALLLGGCCSCWAALVTQALGNRQTLASCACRPLPPLLADVPPFLGACRHAARRGGA
jgi:hypothetical protein